MYMYIELAMIALIPPFNTLFVGSCTTFALPVLRNPKAANRIPKESYRLLHPTKLYRLPVGILRNTISSKTLKESCKLQMGILQNPIRVSDSSGILYNLIGQGILWSPMGLPSPPDMGGPGTLPNGSGMLPRTGGAGHQLKRVILGPYSEFLVLYGMTSYWHKVILIGMG